MDKFIENIKKEMLKDREGFVLKNYIEEVYIWELADKWMDMNIQTQEDLEEKLKALGNIVNNENYKNAIKASDIAFYENNKEKEIEAAELIKKIKQTDEYKENSKICNYKLLDKYEEPNTYKTDSFIVHTNMIRKMYVYLEEKLKQAKIQ